MANNMIPRRSDLFDMTPFNFFEDFGRNFFEGFKGNLVRSERSFSSVRRQFAIRNVREEDIKAEYKDGILKVTLPKSAEKLERKTAIPIE